MSFSRDVRFGIRGFRRSPALTVTLLLTLAIGIGACTAVVAIADATILRPLPLRDPDRLVVLPSLRVSTEGLPVRRGFELSRARGFAAFEDVGAYAIGGLNLAGGTEPVRARVAQVTPNVFHLLGVAPRIGRSFLPEEEQPGAANVVILSDGLWRRAFGSDTRVLGRRVELNGASFEIVGVMPAGFAFPAASDIWIPLTVPMTRARTEIFQVLISTTGLARLSPGYTRERANASIAQILGNPGRAAHADGPSPSFANPIRQYYLGDSRARIVLASSVVGLFLLLACVNVAGLLVARSVGRRREMAIRNALGASTSRLVLQLLVETLVLVVIGGFAGIAVAKWLVALLGSLTPVDLIALTPPRLDWRVAAATTAIAVTTVIIVSILPALVATRGRVSETLKAGGLSALHARGASRLLKALVVAEIAIAVTLLVASGLMLKSLAHLFAVDAGIRMDGVVTARVALPRARYASTVSRSQFFNDVIGDLSHVPGVHGAAFAQFLPLSSVPAPELMVDVAGSDTARSAPAEQVRVTPQYFSVMGIQVRRGRGLTAVDATGHVAVVSDAFARVWPDGQAIGQHVVTSGDSIPRLVVGIVNDVVTTSLDGERHAQVYTPLDEEPFPQAVIVVKQSIGPQRVAAVLRSSVQRLDRQLVVYDIQDMAAVAGSSVAPRRTAGVLAIAFGVISLILAAIGLYGLLAFTTSQKMPELGLRAALGALPREVVRVVIADAFSVTLVGIAVGELLALGANRLLRSLLFEVTPTDLATYVLVPIVLACVAGIAAYPSARKAASADPLSILRSD